MDMNARLAAVTARRAAAGLIARNGIACPNQAWVDYYNARDAEPKDAQGRIILTPELRRLKAAAIASTTRA